MEFYSTLLSVGTMKPRVDTLIVDKRKRYEQEYDKIKAPLQKFARGETWGRLEQRQVSLRQLHLMARISRGFESQSLNTCLGKSRTPCDERVNNLYTFIYSTCIHLIHILYYVVYMDIYIYIYGLGRGFEPRHLPVIYRQVSNITWCTRTVSNCLWGTCKTSEI